MHTTTFWSIQGVFNKRPNFCYKDFILHFKHCPLQSRPVYWPYNFATFLPSLECFLERTFCDGARFSYRILLNLRVFKKRPNFLNSSPTSTEGLIQRTACSRAQFSGCSSTINAHSETGQMAVCCQNLPLGELSSHSAPSVLVGELLKKFGLFLNTVVLLDIWQVLYSPSQLTLAKSC